MDIVKFYCLFVERRAINVDNNVLITYQVHTPVSAPMQFNTSQDMVQFLCDLAPVPSGEEKLMISVFSVERVASTEKCPLDSCQITLSKEGTLASTLGSIHCHASKLEDGSSLRGLSASIGISVVPSTKELFSIPFSREGHTCHKILGVSIVKEPGTGKHTPALIQKSSMQARVTSSPQIAGKVQVVRKVPAQSANDIQIINTSQGPGGPALVTNTHTAQQANSVQVMNTSQGRALVTNTPPAKKTQGVQLVNTSQGRALVTGTLAAQQANSVQVINTSQGSAKKTQSVQLVNTSQGLAVVMNKLPNQKAIPVQLVNAPQGLTLVTSTLPTQSMTTTQGTGVLTTQLAQSVQSPNTTLHMKTVSTQKAQNVPKTSTSKTVSSQKAKQVTSGKPHAVKKTSSPTNRNSGLLKPDSMETQQAIQSVLINLEKTVSAQTAKQVTSGKPHGAKKTLVPTNRSSGLLKPENMKTQQTIQSVLINLEAFRKIESMFARIPHITTCLKDGDCKQRRKTIIRLQTKLREANLGQALCDRDVSVLTMLVPGYGVQIHLKTIYTDVFPPGTTVKNYTFNWFTGRLNENPCLITFKGTDSSQNILHFFCIFVEVLDRTDCKEGCYQVHLPKETNKFAQQCDLNNFLAGLANSSKQTCEMTVFSMVSKHLILQNGCPVKACQMGKELVHCHVTTLQQGSSASTAITASTVTGKQQLFWTPFEEHKGTCQQQQQPDSNLGTSEVICPSPGGSDSDLELVSFEPPDSADSDSDVTSNVTTDNVQDNLSVQNIDTGPAQVTEKLTDTNLTSAPPVLLVPENASPPSLAQVCPDKQLTDTAEANPPTNSDLEILSAIPSEGTESTPEPGSDSRGHGTKKYTESESIDYSSTELMFAKLARITTCRKNVDCNQRKDVISIMRQKLKEVKLGQILSEGSLSSVILCTKGYGLKIQLKSSISQFMTSNEAMSDDIWKSVICISNETPCLVTFLKRTKDLRKLTFSCVFVQKKPAAILYRVYIGREETVLLKLTDQIELSETVMKCAPDCASQEVLEVRVYGVHQLQTKFVCPIENCYMYLSEMDALSIAHCHVTMQGQVLRLSNYSRLAKVSASEDLYTAPYSCGVHSCRKISSVKKLLDAQKAGRQLNKSSLKSSTASASNLSLAAAAQVERSPAASQPRQPVVATSTPNNPPTESIQIHPNEDNITIGSALQIILGNQSSASAESTQGADDPERELGFNVIFESIEEGPQRVNITPAMEGPRNGVVTQYVKGCPLQVMNAALLGAIIRCSQVCTSI